LVLAEGVKAESRGTKGCANQQHVPVWQRERRNLMLNLGDGERSERRESEQELVEHGASLSKIEHDAYRSQTPGNPGAPAVRGVSLGTPLGRFDSDHRVDSL
jgi:hypothetical protein